MESKTVRIINALTTGTTNIDLTPGGPGINTGLYLIQGSVTLTGNYNIATTITGSYVTGSTLTFENEASFTLRGNHIYILGEQVPDNLASKKYKAFSYYDGTRWVTEIYPSFTESEIVSTDNIVDSAVTTVKVNNLAITNAKINDVDGSKIAALSIPAGKYGVQSVDTNDIAYDAIDTLRIANDNVTLRKIEPISNDTLLGNNSGSTDNPSALNVSQILSMLNLTGLSDLYQVSVTIPSADVLQLNTIPQTIVGPPGAGKAIQVVSANAQMTYNTTPYATYGELDLITDTASKTQCLTQANAFLFGTVDRIVSFQMDATTTITHTQIIENKALLLQTKTGDPTAGDSDIKVDVLYRIINL